MRCQYTRMKGGVWDNISPEAKAFVKSLLQIDPKMRPTAPKALKSAWMRKEFPQDDSTVLAHGVNQHSQEAKLKRAALTTIAHKLSANDVVSLKELFAEYDSSGEGRISLSDFRSALVQSKLSDDDVDTMFVGTVRLSLYAKFEGTLHFLTS